MPDKNQNPEAERRKSTVTESVESFIQKKKAEKETETGEAVSEKMAGVGDEVAEVMVGVEKPKERVREGREKALLVHNLLLPAMKTRPLRLN